MRRRPSTRSAAIVIVVIIAIVLRTTVAFSLSSLSSSSLVSTRPYNANASILKLNAATSSAITSPSILSRIFARRQPKTTVAIEESPTFLIPSIFSASDSRPIVLFDGSCNLCNAGVQLVLDNDRASDDIRGNLRVAALQSRVGQILLARLPSAQREAVLGSSSSGGGGEKYKSIVVAGRNKSWVNSDACLRIGRELRGPLRYLALLAHIIPRFIRDIVYKFLSGQRTRLFGKAAECRLWDDNWDTRFIDDTFFGGRSGQGQLDPFADPSLAFAATSVENDCEEEDEEELTEGDVVRVVSSRPIIHDDIPGHDAGVCSVGLVGTVMRVLERRSYPHPKNVAVRFELEGVDMINHHVEGKGQVTSFEAKFSPRQLRKDNIAT